MYIKGIIFFFLACLALSSYGQVTADKFGKFAIVQDSLFVCAYEQKDIKTYDKLLTEFLSQYKMLPDAEKITFSKFLSDAYYNFSCTYSLLDNKIMALAYLSKAIDAGYADYARIQADKDLDYIRDEKEFKELSEGLRNTNDYLYILKKAGKYNFADNRELPKFIYQTPDDPDLIALRKAFNLDSIAGQGSEESKIINLMHWLHYLIRHDGEHVNPPVTNALGMITYCRKENRGLNCRGLGRVLNQCYLSMGFKSRILTCLPKDSLKIDADCHVIDMVYSVSLKKWLWMDPTNDAYVMNEKGELLSIEEVRERIIKNEPLVLNPDANWNRKISVTKEDYLFRYMAKNLYILRCPANTAYYMESRENEKAITNIKLLPLDYFNQTPHKSEKINPETNSTIITYKTNNPLLFWKVP